MEFERRRKARTELSIAPLIDVVFLLLIFFMLSSHFVSHPGIKITLPEAGTAEQHGDDVIIFIGEDNLIYLDGREILLEELFDTLAEKFDKVKGSVIIKADEKIDLGLAVRVMDISRQAAAEGVVISTRREDAER